MTENLELNELSDKQYDAYLKVNDNSRILDAVTQIVVEDKDLTTPPTHDNGKVWYVAVGATGAWATHDNELAQSYEGMWMFIIPKEGWLIYAKDEALYYIFNGTDLDILTTPGAGETFKVSANDTTTGYLEDKLVVSEGINTTYILELTTLNDGLDEDRQLQIDETKIDHNQLTNYVADEHLDWTQDLSPTKYINPNNILELQSDPNVILVDAADVAALPVAADGFIHITSDLTYKAIGNAPIIWLSPIYIEPQVKNFRLESSNPLTTIHVYVDAYGTGKPFINSDYGNTIYFNNCFISSPENPIYDVKSYTIIFYAFKSGNFTLGQVVTGANSGAYGTIVKEIITGVDTGMLMLRLESGKFQVSPPEVITDPITGSAYAGNVIYRNTEGFILNTTVTFTNIKSFGTVEDISVFNFVVLCQYFRGGWTLANCFTSANADVFYRTPVLEIPYSSQTPDTDFAVGSVITNNVTLATAVVFQDNESAPTTAGILYVTSVTGPFFNTNTFTNGSVTATVNGSMSSITVYDISTFIALFEFNSSFLFLGYNLNGFYFNPVFPLGAGYLAVSLNGSPAIYAGGNYFKTGSLTQKYPTIKLTNCPPEKDSSSIMNVFLETFDATTTPYAAVTIYSASPVSLNHTLHAELIERFKMEYWLNYITQTVNFTVGQYITDSSTLTKAKIVSQVDNGTSGYVIVDTLESGEFAITQFASGGAGVTRITATINTLKDNIEVNIINSTNYNGRWKVLNVTGTTFDIAKTYIPETIVNQKWNFVYPMFNGNSVTTITDTLGGSATLVSIESHMVYTGIEKINISILGRLNLAPASGTNIVLKAFFAKNDILLNRTNMPLRVSSGTYQALLPFGIFEMFTNDYIEYYVQNTGNTSNILCNSCNTVITKV